MGLRETRQCGRHLRGCARTRSWFPLGKALRPPRVIRSWLLTRGSLTQRLQDHYGLINVRVLDQRVGNATADEGRSFAEPVTYRNVVLSDSTHNPLVVAHSILSLRPRGALSIMIKRLGRKALGTVLFSRPGFVREQREWALLDRSDPLFRMVHAETGGSSGQRLWARRAVFRPLRNSVQSVQVTEVFLLKMPQ